MRLDARLGQQADEPIDAMLLASLASLSTSPETLLARLAERRARPADDTRRRRR